MKKLLAIIFTLASLTALNAKPKVIASIFPAYDWAKEIIGTNDVDLSLLMDNGSDLHSYQPTVRDIAKISTADIFIYVGGESDEWVKDALKNVSNQNLMIVNMVKLLGDRAKNEELKEGMEDSHHQEDLHNHSQNNLAHHHDKDEHNNEHQDEIDEHVWLSLKNAQMITTAIAYALSLVDPKNSASYQANLSAYVKKLYDLDLAYIKMVASSSKKTLVFGDRFPFRYLLDDYGIDYYAAFAGCSAETEASFKTVAFLSNKSDELNLNNICVIENSDRKIAQTLIANSKNKNRGIIMLDSMQSTTSKDIKNGANYLSIMEKNLASLREALK